MGGRDSSARIRYAGFGSGGGGEGSSVTGCGGVWVGVAPLFVPFRLLPSLALHDSWGT